MSRAFSVFVPLPRDGTPRCGEKISMWRDDVVAARTMTREAAEAALRLIGDGHIWEHSLLPLSDRNDCYCGDD